MNFVQDRPYTTPDAAGLRLLEFANSTDSDQGKVDVGQVNVVFPREGESPDECRTGIERLKADGLNRDTRKRDSTFIRQGRPAVRLMDWDADYAGLPPIKLPDGRKLETLAECAAYVLELPKRQQEQARWQGHRAAAEGR